MVRLIAVLAFCLLALGASPAAHAAKRVAFVVGIDAYDNLPEQQQLKKAVNDAEAIGEALVGLGYDVQKADNVGRLDFLRQWQLFLNRLEPGDEAAVFFAGHGVEIDGQNFLLPRDVPRVASGEEEVLKASGLSLAALLDQVRDRHPQIGLYILDACRDNPFVDGKGRGIGGTRGLARVEPPSGTFIMFSAGDQGVRARPAVRQRSKSQLGLYPHAAAATEGGGQDHRYRPRRAPRGAGVGGERRPCADARLLRRGGRRFLPRRVRGEDRGWRLSAS